ncbi:MAG: tetratricopeptide repeat protein [Candidatus Sericytochromatia bacterium]|nr:tetratricopeptide repeat protein [Candidatus Tanganyikabacteria bacterium]
MPSVGMTCGSCNHPLPPAAKFCGRCGAPAGRKAPAERRVVSILFAAAAGLGKVDADTCDRFWDAVAEGSGRHGGIVAQASRDFLLVAFGVPVTREDDAERAVLCALDMIKAAGAFTGMELGIGVGTGLAVAGHSPTQFKLRIAGTVVAIAQRLAEMPAEQAVRIDAETRRACQRAIQAKELAADVFGVTGMRSRRAFTAALDEPLVGRAAEAATLDAAWAAALAGHPRLVRIVGEAGMGKSALVRKFLARPALAGAGIRRARCQSYLQDAPFGAVADLLLAMLDLPEHLADAELAAAVSARCPEDAALMGHLLGLEAAAPLPPERLAPAAAAVLSERVLALAANGPCILVFEDFHWVDAATAGWLASLADRLVAEAARVPLLVLTVGREGAPAPSESEVLTTLALPPLAADEALALAAFHLGSTPEALSDRLRHSLDQAVARSQGNPYFLLEMVRELEAAGFLNRRGATWELDPAAADWRLPTTVHAAVAARLDRMAPTLRQILQVAAVLGRRFDLKVLEAIAGREPGVSDVGAAAAELDRLGWLARSGEAGELGFAQGLVQEVAYASLLDERRKDLHRRIGLALEEKMGQGTVRFAATLAQHFAQAEDAERSSRYLAKAADRARSANANAEARTCYRASLEWRERAPDTASLPPREDLLLNLALVETALGNYPEARRLLDARWDAAPESPRALRARGDLLERTGDMAGALAAFRKAVLLAGSDGLELARAMASQANVRRRLGDFMEAIAMCRQALSCLAGLGLPAEAAYVHGVLGICHERMGAFEEAFAAHGEALRLRIEAGDVAGIASSHNNLGAVCGNLGRFADARAHYLQSLDQYRKLGQRSDVGDVLNNLGDLLIRQGDFSAAEPYLQEALALSRKIGHATTTVAALGNLGHLALARGEPAEALSLLDECLDLVLRTGHTEVLAEIRHLRGRTLAALGRTGDAADELGEARQQAGSAGNPGLVEAIEQDLRSLVG